MSNPIICHERCATQWKVVERVYTYEQLLEDFEAKSCVGQLVLRCQALETALRRLIDALDRENRHIEAALLLAELHGMSFPGGYGDELNAAKQALAGATGGNK